MCVLTLLVVYWFFSQSEDSGNTDDMPQTTSNSTQISTSETSNTTQTPTSTPINTTPNNTPINTPKNTRNNKRSTSTRTPTAGPTSAPPSGQPPPQQVPPPPDDSWYDMQATYYCNGPGEFCYKEGACGIFISPDTVGVAVPVSLGGRAHCGRTIEGNFEGTTFRLPVVDANADYTLDLTWGAATSIPGLRERGRISGKWHFV